MKTKILNTVVFVILLISGNTVAQTIEFTYDQSGNRISRNVVYLQPMQSNDSSSFEEAREQTQMLGNKKITISPNPNGGRFSINIEGLEPDTPPQIYLHNLKGSVIYENPKADLLTQIDISQHPKGTYILSLIIGDQHKTWKIIRQ